jgi:hypothetical protein
MSRFTHDNVRVPLLPRYTAGMMIGRWVVVLTLSAFLFFGCSRNPAPATAAAHATVQLRDGTSVSGSVLASSPTEIQIAGDDKITRTIPMTQVKSVDYGDAPAATPMAAANPPAVTASPAPSNPAPAVTPETVPPPPPDPVHEQHVHAEEHAITTHTYVVPVGTSVSVRTEETIDSAKAVEGQTFAAELTREVRDRDGGVVIPRGSNAQIIIRSASKGGKFKNASDLTLDLNSVSIGGRMYRISTQDLVKKGRDGVGANKRTGEFAGGGAAIGAIIGAIAGGGKGAAIGAGSGAGAGAVTQIITKGAAVRIPVESVITFRLDRPLKIVAAE